MDTIAALSTAPYRAAIGVIRLSGPDAFRIAREVLRFSVNNQLIADGQKRNLSFAKITDGNETIDEAVISAFRSPFSYTGEDLVEFSCHGGVFLLRRVLGVLFEHGARQALAGEFTKRAFLNGKTDLTAAEGIMDLIDADYTAASRAAMGQMEGRIGKEIEAVRQILLAPASQLLAFVDYPDDEIGEVDRPAFFDAVETALKRVDALLATYENGRLIMDGIKAVLCGVPNVGKSLLMNRLCGTDRSIVTSQAGTTRDTVTETVIFGGVKLLLTDTAGVRDTEEEIERLGVERSERAMKDAALIFMVFSPDPTEEERQLAAQAEATGAKTVWLFNQCDLFSSRVFPDWTDGKEEKFFISAKTGEGLDALEAYLEKSVSVQVAPDAAVLINARQQESLCRAKAALKRVCERREMTYDCLLEDVQQAIASLGELTGQTVSEQIISDIFSRFCVGK